MRVVVIDAYKQEVREEQLTGDSLAGLQECVGGYIQVGYRFEDRHVVFIDEEGLFKQHTHWFSFEGAHQPFAGNGVVSNADGSGNEIAATLTVDEIRSRVTFLTRSDVHARVRAGEWR